METKKLLLFFSLFLLVGLFSSCGSDGVDCNDAANYASELTNEINALSQAALDFSSDPSTDNCNSYKNAFQSYIDALRPYGDCLDGSTFSSWEADLNAAEQSLDVLPC